MTHINPSVEQRTIRGRNDDGGEAAATWKAAENTGWSQGVDENFRIRIELQETAGGEAKNSTFDLQYNLNGAGWVAVTGTSSVVRAVTSPNVANSDPTTDQLTLGTGTFVAGTISTDGISDSVTITASNHTEVEYVVQILSADVVDGDLIKFRVIYGDATLLEQYAAATDFSVTVVEIAGVTLVVDDALHNHAAEAPALITSSTLVVADAVHAQAADAPVLVNNPLILQQTDQDSPYVADIAKIMEEGGTPGSTEVIINVSTSEFPINFMAVPGSGVSWDAGDVVADLEVSTPDTNLTITRINVQRFDNNGVHQESLGNVILADPLTQGIHRHTIPINAATAPADTDELVLEYKVEGNGSAGITPSQEVVTPFETTLGGGVTLVVQQALHGHSAEAPALTQAHTLAVEEAAHAHAAEAPALVQANVLAPDEATHSHAVDQPALTQANVLAPAEATHSHVADAPSLVQARTLAVAEALHGHTAEAPTLSVPTGFDAGLNFRSTSGFVTDGADETHVLGDDDQYPTNRDGFTFGWETSPGDDARDRDSGVDRRLAGINFHANGVAGTHDFRLDLPSTGEYEIHAAFGDTAGAQVQTVEILDDTTQIALYDSVSTPADEYMDATGVVRTEADWPANEAALSHTFTSTILRIKIGDPDDADSLSTTITHLRVVEVGGGGGVTLTVQEASHGHLAESPSLTQHNILSVIEALHAQTAENVELSTGIILSPEEALHTQTADNLILTQAYQLAVQEALHAHIVDSPSLAQANLLAVAEALHNHTADNITLSTAGVLSIADALHNHSVDNIDLVQANLLSVAEALHTHTADAPTLSQAYLLAVAEALHGLTSEEPILSLANLLDVNEALHALTSEAPALLQANVLNVGSTLHSHSADQPILVQGYLLDVQEALHAHGVDTVTLSSVEFALNVQSALHAHTVDELVLAQENLLAVQSAIHALSSDGVVLFLPDKIHIEEQSLVFIYTKEEALRFLHTKEQSLLHAVVKEITRTFGF